MTESVKTIPKAVKKTNRKTDRLTAIRKSVFPYIQSSS